MRKTIIVVIASILALIAVFPAQGCIGARQAAMGWCGVAISDDATASYWNPAAMVWAKDGVMYDNIGGGTAIAAKYHNYGFFFVDEWDKAYCLLSHGIQLTENSAFGFNVGWETHTAGFCRYNGPAADLSYIWTKNGLTLAMLAQNLGNIRPEIAYNTDYITIAAGAYDLFDICQYFDDDGRSLRDFHAGIELRPVSFLALRGGYNDDCEYLFYGVGICSSFFSLDFMYIGGYDYFSVTCAL